MRVSDLLGDRRAVSPVIGVILMVAITVILAAVIGTFVLGIGSAQSTAPQATFGYDAVDPGGSQPDEMKIFHNGGDTIPADELYVQSNTLVQYEMGGPPGPAKKVSWQALFDADTSTSFGDEVSSGEYVFVEPPDADPELAGKEFRVVWESGGETAVLDTWTVEEGEVDDP